MFNVRAFNAVTSSAEDCSGTAHFASPMNAKGRVSSHLLQNRIINDGIWSMSLGSETELG